MRQSEIDEQNAYQLRRQRDFRWAADVVVGAWMKFEEIEAIAVIGSVAQALWMEVPRFREFRREGIEVFHECKDLDLAVWLSRWDRLGELRRAKDVVLRKAYEKGAGPSVAGHQVDAFLIEAGSDTYRGRLCSYSSCPKGKPKCWVPGCGDIRFNRIVDGFKPYTDLLAPAAHATLYRRGQGRLMSALDLPVPEEILA